MAVNIQDIILQNVPSDGTTIGNGRLLDELRVVTPTLAEQDYWTARDALIDRGVLGKGRGRGGSVYLIDVSGSGDNDASVARVKQQTARTGSPVGRQADLWSFADIAVADEEDNAVEPMEELDITVESGDNALDAAMPQADVKVNGGNGRRTSAIKKSDLYSSLWASCDELRGGMDASQYKDYVLARIMQPDCYQ